MERRWVVLGLVLLFLPTVVALPALAEERTALEDGHAEWEVDETLRLFVEGLDAEEAVLQRNGTDGTVGGFTLTGGSGEVQVFSLTSAPLQQPINGTVNMSAFFSVHLVNPINTRACSSEVLAPPCCGWKHKQVPPPTPPPWSRWSRRSSPTVQPCLKVSG